ncbi:hypothetical protein E2986_12585 [Frieseomelitta varia]|uniref:Eyes absent homolog n=1 Tax=Frieseomelitta varia TaxID=561572 RepID=A0A833VSA6_9HYME|nr:hypothetical protein E2986_12585 [Frieseomelitta varia]
MCSDLCNKQKLCAISLYNSPPYGSTTAGKNTSGLQSSYLTSYTTPSSMTQYSSYATYNSGTTNFPNVAQNISPSSQKLEYSAYSSSLYGNDRVPLQYSGYYPMHGYHATPASFNIGNLNFADAEEEIVRFHVKLQIIKSLWSQITDL